MDETMIRRKFKPMLCPFCLAEVLFTHQPENGRHGFTRSFFACPSCDEPIPRMYVDDYRSYPPVVVSAVGFPQHGKTVYFSSLFYAFRYMNLTERWPGFYTQCVNDESLTQLWDGVRELNNGRLPTATAKTFPKPTLLRVKGYPGIGKCTLVMYDTAGESFYRPSQVVQYARFVQRARTVLFFVSLPRIVQDGDEPDEVLHKLLEAYVVGMRELGARRKSQRLVIVFTMADAAAESFGDQWSPLRDELVRVVPGDESNRNYFTGVESISQRLKEFVNSELQAMNFISLCDDFFASTSFSIVSALGAAPEKDNTIKNRVSPRRVFDPLLFVLRETKTRTWRFSRKQSYLGSR